MARRDGKREITHYVPQMLLRFHAIDPCARRGSERIWCFDKKTGTVFCPNIRNIAAESRFYGVDLDDRYLNLEEPLSKLETKVSPILSRSLKNVVLQIGY